MVSEELEIYTVPFEDRDITLHVRRGKRTRHVRLSVEDGGRIVASIPMRFRLGRLDAIVVERREWLDEVLQRAEIVNEATKIDLRGGDPVRYLGGWLRTSIEPGGRGRCKYDADSQSVTIVLPEGGDPFQVLHKWYKNQARDIITERVYAYAEVFDLKVGALSFRDQRTRWGSCSSKADLSFNWRLVLAPMWVLDAIVVHELTHIDELNHSSAFWNLLDRRYPEHRDAQEWLTAHGPALRVTPTQEPRVESTPVAKRRKRGPLNLSLFD